MSENVLETIRATVQDFLAPEIKTHGVRLDNIERRIDEMRSSLEHRIDDSKETLRAEMRALDARLVSLENLIRSFMQQVSMEASLRERVASLEARMPRQ
jgi:division protein CdvB (Snf7/Vps24/ESCRT-III family)